jgi:hypothetical protein
MTADLTPIGIFFMVIGLYGVFATYRVLRFRELHWDYPFINREKEKNYSKAVYILVGGSNIPIIFAFLYLALICLKAK